LAENCAHYADRRVKLELDDGVEINGLDARAKEIPPPMVRVRDFIESMAAFR
jgi:hypothetical protein